MYDLLIPCISDRHRDHVALQEEVGRTLDLGDLTVVHRVVVEPGDIPLKYLRISVLGNDQLNEVLSLLLLIVVVRVVAPLGLAHAEPRGAQQSVGEVDRFLGERERSSNFKTDFD